MLKCHSIKKISQEKRLVFEFLKSKESNLFCSKLTHRHRVCLRNFFLSLHRKGLELHSRLVEEVVVRVAVEDVAIFVSRVSHQLDVHAVLLEEISRHESLGLFEASVVGCSRVKVGLFASALLEPSEDQDLRLRDLKGTHVELSLWQLELEQLPAVLALAQPLNARRGH